MKGKREALDRARNNQRKSRARKKQYIRELEDRLRQFEVQMHAAFDRQAKIMEENRQLRLFLSRHGCPGLDIPTVSTQEHQNQAFYGVIPPDGVVPSHRQLLPAPSRVCVTDPNFMSYDISLPDGRETPEPEAPAAPPPPPPPSEPAVTLPASPALTIPSYDQPGFPIFTPPAIDSYSPLALAYPLWSSDSTSPEVGAEVTAQTMASYISEWADASVFFPSEPYSNEGVVPVPNVEQWNGGSG